MPHMLYVHNRVAMCQFTKLPGGKTEAYQYLIDVITYVMSKKCSKPACKLLHPLSPVLFLDLS